MTKVEGFPERLHLLRVQRGLSKSALARAVGVSTTCVWNWEEGNTFPRPDALSRTVAALSTTDVYLQRGVDFEPRPSALAATGFPASAHTGETVSEVIRRAREQIAAVAGLTFEQVKVVLEYGA